jgi:preprotein translocase subunit SecA
MLGQILSGITKIVGSRNERLLSAIRPLVVQINALEPEMQKLSDEDLKAKTAEFKERLGKGATLEKPRAVPLKCVIMIAN